MSEGGEGLSKGLAQQVENGLLGDTLGPLSGRARWDEVRQQLTEQDLRTQARIAEEVTGGDAVSAVAERPGDNDGFIGMGPGVDYSSEVRDF